MRARAALTAVPQMRRNRSLVGWLVAGTLPAVLAHAQVVTDGSLGPAGDVSAGIDMNGDAATYLIDAELGEQSGGNLFHSFEAFSIGPDETATFEGPDTVDNVFSRVTGNDVSNLFGTLRSTIEGASVFLFNPNGIAFGPDAQLDVQGSFHASTADEVRFADGMAWPTGSPESGTLLSPTDPAAFGFTSETPAPITVTRTPVGTATTLRLPQGETLSLVGGDVTIAGRNDPVRTIQIESGTVQIASLAGPGEVPIDVAALDVGALPAGSLGDVHITDGTFIDVEGSSGAQTRSGSVVIRGGQLVFDEVSQISAANFSNEDAPNVLDVEVAGTVDITDGSQILSTAFFAAGGGGDIRIAGRDVHVRNAALVNARSFLGTGPGGDITIDAAGALRIETGGQVAASSGLPAPLPGDAGPGGDVRITASTVEVVGPADDEAATSLSASTFGTGPAGSLEIDAGTVLVSGENASIASQGDSGPGGSITIDADSLRVEAGAQVSVSATRGGDAGALVVFAQDVEIDGTAEPRGDDVAPQRSGLFSNSISGASGAAGNITLDVADTLSITNGGQISVSSNSETSGPSGRIDIRTRHLDMQDSLEGIRAASFSNSFDAGDIEIVAERTVDVVDSSISTEATVNSGGNVSITAGKQIELRRRDAPADEPLVTAEVGRDQIDTVGGSVMLDAKTVVVDTAGVLARSPGGLGGNIEVVADAFLVSDGDLVEVSPGFFSSGGQVFGEPGALASTGAYFDVSGALETGSFVVRSPSAAVVSSLTSLSQSFLDVTKLSTNACSGRSQPIGSLVLAGPDQVPATPAERARPLYLTPL